MTLLRLAGIAKQFAGTAALRRISLEVAQGEVVAIAGDAGAGKSTLLRIVAGEYPPTEGTLLLDDREIRFAKPDDARRQGIASIRQDLALCDNLTAAANIFLGRELYRRLGPLRILDRRAMDTRAAALLAALGAAVGPGRLVGRLSGGERQAVAIARVMLADARLVLMDEPTAALSVRQTGEVLDLVRRYRQRGIAVLIAGHDLAQHFAVADRIVVLRRGEVVVNTSVDRADRLEIARLVKTST